MNSIHPGLRKSTGTEKKCCKKSTRHRKEELPLFPRINASPYLFFNCPFTYSSVCSRAMFIYPSRQARTPEESDSLKVNQLRLIFELNRKALHLNSASKTIVFRTKKTPKCGQVSQSAAQRALKELN